MLTRRTVVNLLVSSTFLTTAATAFAKKHNHHNGHSLLGGKLKQNGRHQIHKAGQATVSADVNNGKVTALTANHPQKGNLPAQKVKSRKKMVEIEPSGIRVALADNGSDGVQLAQLVEYYYYAWCFDDGVDEYCYWFPAEAVLVDGTWIEYIG